MIKLDYSNLFQISVNHGLTEEELLKNSDSIADFLEKIHARKQGFYEILDDKAAAKKIRRFAEDNAGRYQHFVVLGIGGSALGTICIQQALTHLYKEQKLFVLDNIDPIMLKEIEEVIDPEKTLFIVVTKSGTTPETLAQYFYFRKKAPKENFVFITDPKKGLLREISEREEITTFDLPENVGGRFSVLTAVGLLPAALLSIDIYDLLAGARRSRSQFLSQNWNENLPFQLAAIQYLLSRKKKTINVLMPYAQKLMRLADWYQQLLAESIGKTEYIGLTPTSALGATDQHSQLQLFSDGPNDKLIIFIELANSKPEIKIPDPEVDFLKGVTFNKLLKTEKHGTEQALTKQDRPNLTIQIDQITPETLGELFMLFEGSIAFLGEFFQIDAFDQPGVELSKKITKELLQK